MLASCCCFFFAGLCKIEVDRLMDGDWGRQLWGLCPPSWGSNVSPNPPPHRQMLLFCSRNRLYYEDISLLLGFPKIMTSSEIFKIFQCRGIDKKLLDIWTFSAIFQSLKRLYHDFGDILWQVIAFILLHQNSGIHSFFYVENLRNSLY